MSLTLENLEDKTLTPEKKPLLANEINNELNNINDILKKGSNSEAKKESLVSYKDLLQKELDDLFNRKGVITPEETNKTLNKIKESKKARLESDFYSGIKNYSIIIGVFIAIGVGIYIYQKNKSK
jgi:hypothetical protein